MAYMQYGRNILRHIVKDVGSQSSDRVVNPLLYVCQGVRYRKLEVILTTNIDKLGKAGETVKVAPGYFRNHLMPKLLAVPNIEKFAYLISEQRKLYQPEEVEEVKEVVETEEDKMKEYHTAAKRLETTRVAFRRFIKFEKGQPVRKGEPLELRSPITKDDLVAEVARQLSVQVEPESLHLPSPLTHVGEFEVPLRLPKSIPLPEGKVRWTLKVKIRCK
ncbi:hypothetical protein AAG906_007037 [Vitis piasezkii]